jgi:hypothetical protein
MIRMGIDKLMSLNEIIANLRVFAKQERLTRFDIDRGSYDFELSLLAACVDEDVEYIKGAIR